MEAVNEPRWRFERTWAATSSLERSGWFVGVEGGGKWVLMVGGVGMSAFG